MHTTVFESGSGIVFFTVFTLSHVLSGIEEKAEYFKDIGVDCVWLSPIFKSPMVDFGYDISDFNQIDKTFGTMDDFISLYKKLKSLGNYLYYNSICRTLFKKFLLHSHDI